MDEDKIHQEIAQEAAVDETDRELSPGVRKWIVVFGTIVSLFLLITFVLPAHAFTLLAAQLNSYPLVGNEISVGETTIVFEEGALSVLLGWYFTNQQHEIKVCLVGESVGNQVLITDLYQPRIFSQSFSHVTSSPCGGDTVISLHTHPYQNCFLSNQDVRNYEQVAYRNRDAFVGIMCQEDRFNFYGI